MQDIYFVENGNLEEVKKALRAGWEIVSVNPIAENIVKGVQDYSLEYSATFKGEVYAYIVMENPNIHNL